MRGSLPAGPRAPSKTACAAAAAPPPAGAARGGSGARACLPVLGSWAPAPEGGSGCSRCPVLA